MHHYELLTIVTGKLADTEVPAVIQKVEEVLKKQECVIHYTQNLERRKLAYPIDHQMYGTYVLIEFDSEGEKIKNLEHDFRLSNELLRHVIVKRETVGKPRPLFKDTDGTYEEKRPPVKREGKTVTLEQALHTLETDTDVLSSPSATDAVSEKKEDVAVLKRPVEEVMPVENVTPKTLAVGEDVEKELDKKLEEILRDGF